VEASCDHVDALVLLLFLLRAAASPVVVQRQGDGVNCAAYSAADIRSPACFRIYINTAYCICCGMHMQALQLPQVLGDSRPQLLERDATLLQWLWATRGWQHSDMQLYS
jgi:hypothetical protein